MSAIVSCRCGGQFNASPEIYGKTVNCPACGHPLQIPNPLQAVPPASLQPPGAAPVAGQDPFGADLTTAQNAPESPYAALYGDGGNPLMNSGGSPAAPASPNYSFAPSETGPADSTAQRSLAQPAKPTGRRRQGMPLHLIVPGGVIAVGFVIGVMILVAKVASRDGGGGAVPRARAARARSGGALPEQTADYATARKTFQTRLTRKRAAPQQWKPLQTPSGAQRITYRSGGLRLAAFVDPAPADGKPRPGVLFLHGGFAYGEGDWEMAQPFRDAGYVVMMPVLRGENGQPGHFTLYFSEVEDVLAAGSELAKLPYVDSSRVFITGHSAGGTLTTLAAMASKQFRAAASLCGCMDQKLNRQLAPFDKNATDEFAIRSPLSYAGSLKCPTRLFYGSREFQLSRGNLETARRARQKGLDVQARVVAGDHFSAVQPAIRQTLAFFAQHGGPSGSGSRAAATQIARPGGSSPNRSGVRLNTGSPSRHIGSSSPRIPTIPTPTIPSPTIPRTPTIPTPRIPSIRMPRIPTIPTPRIGPRFGPRVGPSRTGPSRIGPSRIGPSRIGPSRVGPSRPGYRPPGSP